MLLLLRSLLDTAGVVEPPVVTTPVGEVVIRHVYVRRGRKIHLFRNVGEADRFLDAERQAQEAIEKAKSKSAKRRAKRKVYAAMPESTEIDAGWADAMTDQIRASTNEENQPDYETILRMLVEMQDEQDIELLLFYT